MMETAALIAFGAGSFAGAFFACLHAARKGFEAGVKDANRLVNGAVTLNSRTRELWRQADLECEVRRDLRRNETMRRKSATYWDF